MVPDPHAASDPFELLGLPARFDLDELQLQRAWLTRAAQLHPDRGDAGGGATGALAALNHARSTLADPERRADALLLRMGGPAREADKSLPDGFLAEILEVREAMEEALAMRRPEELARFAALARERRSRHIREVGELLAGAGNPPDPAVLKRIRQELNAWRYAERMLEQASGA